MLWAMPRIARLDGLDELLDKQLSVVSRGQLLTLGMTDKAMQYRVRPGGPWQALLPGVYLAVSGTPSLPQKEMAALLYAGPGSLITGPVALLHHSIRSVPSLDVIDVLVPVERQRRHWLRPAPPHGPDAGPDRHRAARYAWPWCPAPWPIPLGSSPASETFAPWSRTPSSSAGAR